MYGLLSGIKMKPRQMVYPPGFKLKEARSSEETVIFLPDYTASHPKYSILDPQSMRLRYITGKDQIPHPYETRSKIAF
jgi:hypothetical protein